MDITVMHLIPSVTLPVSPHRHHYHHDPSSRPEGSHHLAVPGKLLVLETWSISGIHLSLDSTAVSMNRL